ncbi:MAG: YqgE/AlgH family protein [Bacteroidales bacterium]|nr:YqgE/AlgH family protein [Bacteroidales bacterium]
MILDYNFFEADNDLEPQKGVVLVSEPFLTDNYFRRSIVLLTEHNEEGTVGFVLNKPIDIKINDVIEDFPETNADIALGGPVNTNTLHYLHTMGDIIPNSVPVIGNVMWGGSFEVVERLIRSGNIQKGQIRFFLGYSGWSPDQLESELDENAWVITSITSEQIMKPMNQQIWTKTLRGMGKKYEMWSNFPENPELN